MANERPASEPSPGYVELDGGPTEVSPISDKCPCPECGEQLVRGRRAGEDTFLYWCLNPSCGWGPAVFLAGCPA